MIPSGTAMITAEPGTIILREIQSSPQVTRWLRYREEGQVAQQVPDVVKHHGKHLFHGW